MIIPGQILILALAFRRLPSARLLLVFSAVPQFLQFYDQVMLFLIPRTGRQYVALTAASWVAYAGFKWLAPLVLPRWHPLRVFFFWDVCLDIFVLGLVAVQYFGWDRVRAWFGAGVDRALAIRGR
jgi:hypothetical protein